MSEAQGTQPTEGRESIDWKRFYDNRSDDWNIYTMPKNSLSYFKRVYRHWLVQGYVNRLCPKGSRVLDAGCGHGYSSIIAEQSGYRPVSLDLSAATLKEFRYNARKMGARPEIIHGDLTHGLPFRDGTFGAIICQETVEHIEAIEPVIAEFSRVLTPGGVAVIAVPYKENIKKNVCPKCGYHFHIGGHQHTFDEEVLYELLGRHAFDPLDNFVFHGRFAFRLSRMKMPFGVIRAFDALFRNTRFRGSHIVVAARRR